MTTPEGWTEAAWVKTCALGAVGAGKSGERGGAWPTHLALWGWVSIWVLIFSRRSLRLPCPRDHGSLPSAGVLGLFGSGRDQGIPLGSPKQRNTRDWGEGGRFQRRCPDSLPPGREVFPQGKCGGSPEGFLLLGPLLPRSDLRQATCSSSSSSSSRVAGLAAPVPPEHALHFLRGRDALLSHALPFHNRRESSQSRGQGRACHVKEILPDLEIRVSGSVPGILGSAGLGLASSSRVSTHRHQLCLTELI